MIGGVTRHMLPHLPGVPQLHVNRPLVSPASLWAERALLSLYFNEWENIIFSRNLLRKVSKQIQMSLCREKEYLTWSTRKFLLLAVDQGRQ